MINRKEYKPMKEVFEFLRNCGTFFLATDEEGRPHVRPFGALCDYDGNSILKPTIRKRYISNFLKMDELKSAACMKGNGFVLRVS